MALSLNNFISSCFALFISDATFFLSSGDYSIRFRPHLTVSKEEIDIAIDILYKSIKEITLTL